MYDILVAVIIGITQGITEFLPISSTAHNRLVSGILLGGKDIGLDVSNIFQFGTLVAIIKYFWSDLREYFWRLVRIMTNKKTFGIFVLNIKSWINGKLPENTSNIKFEQDIVIAQLAIATFPIVILGFAFRKLAQDLRTNFWIGVFLIVGAGLMWAAELFLSSQKPNPTQTKNLNLLQSITIGFFQCLAILPGMSRSGSTISGAFLAKVSRKQAVRFSFLLSIPAVGLSGIKDGFEVLSNLKNLTLFPTQNVMDTGKLSLLSIIIGTIASYFVGMWCLKWLLKYLSTNTFGWFVVYRVVIGLVLIFVIK